MRINEAVEIINGSLLNQPSISYFGNITSNLFNVVRSTLFIATNEKDAKEAIAMGAYGIIFEDGSLEIIDEESAWIKVDLLQDAITRLIRYKLLSSEISVIYLKKIEFEIAKEIATDPRLTFLQGGYSDFLEATQKQGIKKIITNNPSLLDIPLEYAEAIIPQNEPFKIISCTLFDSKIYFDSKRYTLSLPSIFLGHLASVLALFENEKISFMLSNFESIPYLRPIFITSQGLRCAYGQSGKVLLAEKNKEPFKYYANYITENAKWAKILFFLPNDEFQTEFSSFPIQIYHSQEELLALMKEKHYNFGLILGVDSSFLLENLLDEPKEMSLFND